MKKLCTMLLLAGTSLMVFTGCDNGISSADPATYYEGLSGSELVAQKDSAEVSVFSSDEAERANASQTIDDSYYAFTRYSMIAGNGFANALESIFSVTTKSLSTGFALHIRDETSTPERWSSDVYDTGSFTIHSFDLTAGADIRQLFAFADQSSHLAAAIATFAAAKKSGMEDSVATAKDTLQKAADTYAGTLLDSLSGKFSLSWDLEADLSGPSSASDPSKLVYQTEMNGSFSYDGTSLSLDDALNLRFAAIGLNEEGDLDKFNQVSVSCSSFAIGKEELKKLIVIFILDSNDALDDVAGDIKVTPAALLLNSLDTNATVSASSLINDTVYWTKIDVAELRNMISSI